MKKRRQTRPLIKNILLAVAGLLVILLVTVLIAQYIHYRNDPSPYRTFCMPRVEVGDFDLVNINGDQNKLDARLLIHNPLPISIRADSLQYQFFINEVEVMHSTHAKSIQLPHWDSTWISLPVTIKRADLLKTLDQEDERGHDSVTYKLITTFYTRVPFKLKMKICTDKFLPLFYPPVVKVEKITYDDLTLKGITKEFHISVKNQNKYPIKLRDLSYELDVAGHSVMKGTKDGMLEIKAKDVTSFILPVRISFGGYVDSLGDRIFKGGKTDYDFALSFNMVTDNKSLAESKMMVHDKGTLKELKQFVKEEQARSAGN